MRPKIQSPKSKVLTCEHRRRVVATPAAAEPEVAPVPRTIDPAQAPDAEVASGAAVDSPPEEDIASVATRVILPRFRDELGVFAQVVEDVGIQNGQGVEFLAEFIALDVLPVLLAF